VSRRGPGRPRSPPPAARPPVVASWSSDGRSGSARFRLRTRSLPGRSFCA